MTRPPATPLRLLLVAAPLLGGCTERIVIDAEVPRRDPSSEWASLLREASSPEGVDYDYLRQRQGTLDRYLAWVGEHGPRKDQWGERREDRSMAFLVNAYNAAVIKGVLVNEPLDSVRDVDVGPWRYGGSGFFVGQRFRVDGEWLSLHNLSHQLIVNRYQEPLLHAALVCASDGCPQLRWWPSGKRSMQPAMERAMRAFLATDDGLQVVGEVGADGLPEGLRFSELFAWYEDDFLDWSDAATVCEYLAPYAEGPRQAWLQAHAADCPMETFPYDWSLNHAPRPAVRPDDPEEDAPHDGQDADDTGDIPG